MKRKFLFILSLVVSLALAGAVILALFPNVKNIFSKKTQTIEVSQPSIQQAAADNQPGKTEFDSDSESNPETDSEAENVPVQNAPQEAKPPIGGLASNAASTDTEVENKTPAQTTSGKIVQDLVSWGFQKGAGRTIEAVIIHSSYNALGGDPFDFSKVVEEWKEEGVSPHYAIDRAGTIYQLVADQNIAYHAGVSTLPDGKTDVNGVSIGIEMINTETDKFTDAQYASLNWLLAILKQKYPIEYILGHDQIAPGRKTDPWNIDWSRVAK